MLFSLYKYRVSMYSNNLPWEARNFCGDTLITASLNNTPCASTLNTTVFPAFPVTTNKLPRKQTLLTFYSTLLCSQDDTIEKPLSTVKTIKYSSVYFNLCVISPFLSLFQQVRRCVTRKNYIRSRSLHDSSLFSVRLNFSSVQNAERVGSYHSKIMGRGVCIVRHI